MLEIKINEQIIDIDSNFSGVDIELINSLFSEKTTHSFSFYLPKTESVIKALNYSVLSHSYVNSILNTITFTFGLLHISGMFKIVEVTDEIECYFINGTNNIIEKFKTLKLRDLNYSVSANIDAAAAGSYPTYAYTAFPVEITNDEVLAHFADDIPEAQGGVDMEAAVFVNYPLDSGDIISGELKCDYESMSYHQLRDVNYIRSYYNPFFYVSFVVKQIFETLGINLRTNIFDTDSDLMKLAIVYFNPTESVSTIYLKDYVPDITAAEFLKAFECLGIKVIYDFERNEAHIIQLIDKVNAPPQKDLTSFTSKIKSIGVTERHNYRLKYDLDQDDLYLEETGTFDDYNYIDNSNNTTIELNFNICPIATQADIADPPDVSDGRGYYIKTLDLGGDVYRYFYRQWEIPKVQMKFKVSETDSTKLICETEQKLRILFFDNTIEEAFRLYYTSGGGADGTTLGQEFPSGLYYTPTLNLKWYVATGIGVFTKKMKSLLIWENNIKKPLKAEMNLTPAIINDHKDEYTYIIDNYKCFISKIKLALKSNKIEVDDVELYTV